MDSLTIMAELLRQLIVHEQFSRHTEQLSDEELRAWNNLARGWDIATQLVLPRLISAGVTFGNDVSKAYTRRMRATLAARRVGNLSGIRPGKVDEIRHYLSVLDDTGLSGELLEHLRVNGVELSAEMTEQLDSITGKRVDHSDDFRSACWYGELHVFSPTQAAVISVLWSNWERGAPVLSEHTILEAAGSSAERLRDVFAKGRHSAWNIMIQSAGKGSFGLFEPQQKPQ